MQFNNIRYPGSFFVFALCFSLDASKAGGLLNNDGAAAACLPWPLKNKMTANHFPQPLAHQSPLPAGFSSDWIKALTCVAR